MLNTLRASNNASKIVLCPEFQKDVYWWYLFTHHFNGVSIMPENYWSDATFTSDASGTRAGGFYQGHYFHVSFPEHLLLLPIHVKEMLALIAAVKLWGDRWAGKKIIAHCDNMACVLLINSNRSRDPWMQACIRELWYIACGFSLEIRAKHIQSSVNTIADHLSRWHLSPNHQSEFQRLTKDFNIVEHRVNTDIFSFSHDW